MRGCQPEAAHGNRSRQKRAARWLMDRCADVKQRELQGPGQALPMQNIDFATEGFKKLLPTKHQGRVFRQPSPTTQ